MNFGLCRIPGFRFLSGLLFAGILLPTATLSAQAPVKLPDQLPDRLPDPLPDQVVKPGDRSIPRGKGSLVIEPFTFSQRLTFYAKDSFSPGSLLVPALPAAILMAAPPSHYPREWRQGAEAYGRNFGDSLATEQAANAGKFLAAAVTREDPRYYPDRETNIAHRAWYAIAFTVVDRNDHGHPALAVSNFAGAAAAGFLGSAYLPRGYNDAVHAGQRSGGTLGGYSPTLLVGYATQNLISEFAPEFKRLGRKLHLPFIPREQHP